MSTTQLFSMIIFGTISLAVFAIYTVVNFMREDRKMYLDVVKALLVTQAAENSTEVVSSLTALKAAEAKIEKDKKKSDAEELPHIIHDIHGN